MIKVYTLNINDYSYYKCLGLLMTIVSPDRRDQINRMKFLKDKTRTLYSELLLIFILFNYYDITIGKSSIKKNIHGKPYLFDNKKKFNISHSGDYIVCIISDSEVGIDVEELVDIELDFLDVFLSEKELSLINVLSCKDKLLYMYKYWTFKESYSKYTGEGLNTNFRELNLDIISKKLFDTNTSVILPVDFFNIDLGSNYIATACFKQGLTIDNIIEVKLYNIVTFFKTYLKR